MVDFDKDNALELTLSVIIPLLDHRGQAIACIKSWAQEQTYDREKFEVIVIANGSEPQLESRARELLAPQDSLIYHSSSNEFLLYDLGARQARGKLLLFTESHCFGESACLAEVSQFFATHEDVVGAC